ncbi:hypothetical protein [Halarcobacter anaerophilus]|uniref:hypothetical protein n=1 Tax=Halarcobacter anaerophilus TaxID=877500 RepID=UPI000698910B|nr:hypothetical protein [Halarcobacter anaerophilus]
MVLDITFTVIGSFLILSLIPLYIYRKEIYRKFSKAGDTKTLINDLKSYLSANCPKIKFDYNVLKKFEKESDIRVKQTLIVEELIKQFAYFQYEMNTQKSVPHNMLWSSYDQNSKLLKDNKLPKDWTQRKKRLGLEMKGNATDAAVKRNFQKQMLY